MRALIIDDEPAIRQMLGAVMMRAGWEVEARASAEDALELLTWEQFDALLIDKNLPGMDGVELVRQIRATDRRVVCVMITGYANTESAKETLNLGIDAYIQKPLDNVVALPDRVGELMAARLGRRDTAPTAAVDPALVSAIDAVILSTDAKVCGQVTELLGDHDLSVVEPLTMDAAVVDTIRSKRPRLLIFDGSRGTKEVIKALNATPPVPAYVVITGSEMPLAEVVGFIDLGVKALVETPIHKRQFDAAMRNVLEDLGRG